jgi:hypothetical protein
MDAVERLLSWWQRPHEVSKEDVFHAASLSSTDGSDGDVRDVVFAREIGAAWSDVTIVSRVDAGPHTAIMFDGLDPITLLWHRVAWHVQVKDDRVMSMWVCGQILGDQRPKELAP